MMHKYWLTSVFEELLFMRNIIVIGFNVCGNARIGAFPVSGWGAFALQGRPSASSGPNLASCGLYMYPVTQNNASIACESRPVTPSDDAYNTL